MNEDMMGLICVTVLAILLVCILVVTAKIVVVYMRNSKKKKPMPPLRHKPSKLSHLAHPKSPDTVGQTTINERYSRIISALMNNNEDQKHIYDVIDANEQVSPNKQTYENLKLQSSALPYQNLPMDSQNGMMVSPTAKRIASYLEPNDIHSMNLVQPNTKSASTRKPASYVEPEEISPLNMALFKAELAEEEKQKKMEKERQEEAMNKLQQEMIKKSMKKK